MAVDTEISQLKYTPSLCGGPESAQFRPLVAASPSDEFSESSGSLSDTLGTTRCSMRLAHAHASTSATLSTHPHSARSLAHKPSMEECLPNKRQRVSAKKSVSMLDEVEACTVFGLTGCSHHQAYFASVFQSASHDSDEAMIKCYLDLYRVAELSSVRRSFATATRLTRRVCDQSAKEDEVDLFNLRHFDYVVRRAFMICLLVGLVNGTARELRAFRLQVGMKPVDGDKARQWDDDGMNECFYYDYWAFEDGEEEVFETLHPRSRYVQHLWQLKGFPDLKRDWLRAVAVLEKCESVHPM